MSQTNQEKKQIAKRITRRKRYVTHRNKLHGRKKTIILTAKNKAQEIDGAEYYRQLKEKENNDQNSQQKGKGIKGFFQNLFRGAQRGQ